MQHKRITTYLAVAAVAAALFAFGAQAASAATTVKVSGVITGFTPKTITVKAGEEVTIALTSPDIDHDLTIAAADFKVTAPKGKTVSGTFTAPSKAGNLKFICSVPGHEAAGMTGTLVVEAAAAPAPGGSSAPAATPTSDDDAPAESSTPAKEPVGAPATGGGSTAGWNNLGLLALGGGLLLAAAISTLLGLRVARRH